MMNLEEFIKIVKNMSREELEEIRQQAKKNLNNEEYKYLGVFLGIIRNESDEDKIRSILKEFFISDEPKVA